MSGPASGAPAHPSPAAALKRRLAGGQALTVVNADHPSPSLVEALGRLPIDAVFIDCEQGSPDFETVEDMARAARLAGLASLVRVFGSEDWIIERFLLRGVDGLVVPRIDTPDQARRAVAAVRYCFPETHSQKILVVQIESVSAVRHLAEILAIDGIDVFFVGPVDLAKSLGYGGLYTDPRAQAEIDRVIGDIRAASRHAGMLVDHGSAERYRRAGVQFLYVHANAFLAVGADAFAAAVRRAGA